MDPTTCLMELLLSLSESDKDGGHIHADDLVAWLSKGGFTPDVDKAIAEFNRRREASKTASWQLGYHSVEDAIYVSFDPEQNFQKIINTFSHPSRQKPQFIDGARCALRQMGRIE